MDSVFEMSRTDGGRIKSATLALCAVMLAVCGCVRGPRESVGRLFDSVPSWKQADAVPTAEPESIVSANTALPSESSEVSEAVTITENPVEEKLARVGAEPNLDSFADSDAPRADREPNGPKIWDRRVVSQAAENTVHRLKRALSSDSRPNAATTGEFSRQHPIRVKVDGLHHEAEQLLREGDYHEAKAVAERAVEMAESVALEYLPNEERPDDLLQRILTAIDNQDLAPVAGTASSGTDESDLPILKLPADDVFETVPVDASHGPNSGSSSAASMGTAAANRPLILPDRAFNQKEPIDLVVIEPVLSDVAAPASDGPSAGAVGLKAPFSEPRFLARNEAGPLVVSTEARPAPPQIADVAPLPAFKSGVVPRTQKLVDNHPTFTFVWADLWPLWMLAAVIVVFGTALLGRRLITGH